MVKSVRYSSNSCADIFTYKIGIDVSKKKRLIGLLTILIILIGGHAYNFYKQEQAKFPILRAVQEHIKSCSKTIAERIDAPYIFTAEVEEIFKDDLTKNLIAKLQIKKIYKAENKPEWFKSNAIVNSQVESVDIDTPINVIGKVGDNYLIFSRYEKRREDMRLFVMTQCGDFKRIDSFDENEPKIKELKQALKKWWLFWRFL